MFGLIRSCSQVYFPLVVSTIQIFLLSRTSRLAPDYALCLQPRTNFYSLSRVPESVLFRCRNQSNFILRVFDPVALANGQIFFSFTRKSLTLLGFGVVTGQVFSALVSEAVLLRCRHDRIFFFALTTSWIRCRQRSNFLLVPTFPCLFALEIATSLFPSVFTVKFPFRERKFQFYFVVPGSDFSSRSRNPDCVRIRRRHHVRFFLCARFTCLQQSNFLRSRASHCKSLRQISLFRLIAFLFKRHLQANSIKFITRNTI
jgi:hypothetical protein